MKALRVFPILLAGFLTLSLLLVAQGPVGRSSDPVARPKKGADSAPTPEQQKAPPIPSVFKRQPDAPADAPTFSVNASTVTVDVAVVDNKGHFIPNIPQGNFRITEDDVPQKVSSFSMGEAPMTVALVIEFSNRYQQYLSEPWYQTLVASSEFLNTLRPMDYVAVVAYDLRPEILSDFSTDRRQAADAMSRMRFPAFSETNLYDALTDTANRMQEIEGRKAIVLISTGVDTLSHMNFGEARKAIQNAGVPIYSFGLMQTYRDLLYSYGAISDSQRTDFIMADNQLSTFSKESGGMAFFPRFYGQFREIFQSIGQAMRTQYVLTYTPSNQVRDGKFRKIKVELVDPATNKPLKVTDEKGKALKFEIIAKRGYTAPRPVE